MTLTAPRGKKRLPSNKGAETQEEVKMKKTVFLGALTVAGFAASVASASTLDDVKARGTLELWRYNRLGWLCCSRRKRRMGRF